jgi:2-methylcitrate dehydratase PrpD
MAEEEKIPMTEKLATFIVSTQTQNISDEIFEHAKIAFMDWLAVCIAGKNDPLVKKLISHIDIMGGNGQSTVICDGSQRNVCDTALINGAASHALDYDDTLVSFLGHPSVTVFPSVLALCEWKKLSGKDFLTAYLIGIQTGGTIGACASLDHYMAGWHATSTLGPFASAAACARLLKLDKEKTQHALGIAGTQSSGLKRVFGSMCKPFHAGRSAQAGLFAALMAENGFTSATDILEGPQGFFEAFKGNVNPTILSFLGLGWDVVNLSQKYHASCHATHSPVEASLDILQTHKLSLNEIQSITVKSSQLAIDAAGKNEPKCGTEGKFSIHYCIANALIHGETGMQAFTDERVLAPDIQALMKKVSLQLDDKKTALESTVCIQTKDGHEYCSDSDILQQIPPIETKKARVRSKYRDLCEPVLGEKITLAIEQNIDQLQDMTNIADLMAHFRRTL